MIVCVNGIPGSKLFLMLEFNTVFLLISCLSVSQRVLNKQNADVSACNFMCGDGMNE